MVAEAMGEAKANHREHGGKGENTEKVMEK